MRRISALSILIALGVFTTIGLSGSGVARADSMGDPPAAAPSGDTDLARVVVPDLLYFHQRAAPLLHSHCAGCHSDAESAGGYLLRPLKNLDRPSLETVRENFRATLRYLDPREPAASALLTKSLGGKAHGGGAIFANETHSDFVTLQEFALGASRSNRPPDAILPKRMRMRVGAPLSLDGTLSADPDGDGLQYTWAIVDRPSGASPRLKASDDGLAQLHVNKPGAYRIRLTVHDDTLWSAGADMLVIANLAGGVRPPVVAGPMSNDGKKKLPPLWKRRLVPERLRLIRRLYIDLLWRTPRLAEVEKWYGSTHDEMVDALLKREEVWDAWYERQLYFFLLLDRFRPKEGRLASLPKRLANAQVTIPMAVQEIVRSQYFNARNPGNDTFVTVVLEQCLGTVVQERRNLRVLKAGKKMYDGYKTKLFKTTGSSQADFVRIVFAQDQFATHMLQRLWKDLHETEIDPKTLKAAVARAVADPRAYRVLFTEWLKGDAYVKAVELARNKPEIPYVRSLFVDILDRTPTYEELRNVRNAFLSLADPTPIRLVMGRVLMESGQGQLPANALAPEQFVNEQFIRLLARQPSPREAKAFVGALKKDAAVTPRVILWTLISSAEYQGY